MIKQKIVIQYYVPDMYFDKFVLVAWISRIRRPYPDQGNSKALVYENGEGNKGTGTYTLFIFLLLLCVLLNLIII
jgi:hypothetical protein